MNRADAVSGFQQVFKRSPTLVTRAPGRVNLIGEHTDYNDGFVLPVAIEFATWTALAPHQDPKDDRLLRVFAGNRAESIDIALDAPGDPLQHHWSDYVRGIAVELESGGNRLRGGDLWFAGDVPHGAGVSSSAALEMSIGLALLVHAGIAPDRAALARAGQRAEHHYAGTQCGIMDQFISAHGKAGHALMLDCRSLEHRLLPLPDTVRLVICDTGVKHELAGGEYNLRRAQCEEGVERLRLSLAGIQALRDVRLAQFEVFQGTLQDPVRKRCRHVVSEIARVQSFAAALEAHDLTAVGRLMAASHASLRDDYEVSCDELNAMVEAAGSAPGLVGARMTGGGFGGCTVNLVHTERLEAFQRAVEEGYGRRTGRNPRVFVSAASDGAEVVV